MSGRWNKLVILWAGFSIGNAFGVEAKVFKCHYDEPWVKLDKDDKVKEKGQTKVTVEFAVSGLPNKPKLQYIDKESAEEMNAVVVSPEELPNGWSPRATVLNDNIGITKKFASKKVTNTKGKKTSVKTKDVIGFDIEGDGDGEEAINLVLYANNDYQFGYVALKAYQVGWKANVSCTVKDKELEDFESEHLSE